MFSIGVSVVVIVLFVLSYANDSPTNVSIISKIIYCNFEFFKSQMGGNDNNDSAKLACTEPQYRIEPTRPAQSACREMFSLSRSNKEYVHHKSIDKIIQVIKSNMQRDFGGEIEPYSQLAKFLPTLLKKNYINVSNEAMADLASKNSMKNVRAEVLSVLRKYDNERFAHSITEENVAVIRKYMLL